MMMLKLIELYVPIYCFKLMNQFSKDETIVKHLTGPAKFFLVKMTPPNTPERPLEGRNANSFEPTCRKADINTMPYLSKTNLLRRLENQLDKEQINKVVDSLCFLSASALWCLLKYRQAPFNHNLYFCSHLDLC